MHALITAVVCLLIVTVPLAADPPREASGSLALQLQADSVPRAEVPDGLHPRLVPRHFVIRDRKEWLVGAPPHQHDPELSARQWLLVAVDQAGQERYQQLIHDPRIVRAEFPKDDGELAGQTFDLAEVDFLVSLPRDPRLVELRIYQPEWTGEAWELHELGRVSLNGGGQ